MEGILIPVKRLGEAKQRLSIYLTPQERIQLGLTMLSDILSETQQWQERFLVTGDPQASEVGRFFGLEVLSEKESDLNAALQLGTRQVLAKGIKRLLILPADVPAVQRTDLAAIFGCTENVVVASSTDGGTTALLRSPPDAVETVFGPGSARAHLDAAETAGLRARHVRLDSLLLDVDDLQDLRLLAKLPLQRQSVDLAKELLDRQDQPPAA